MKQTIEIEVPEGKKAVWKNNTIVFEDIKQELPKTWEEYCEKYPIDPKEVYLDPKGQITELLIIDPCKRDPNSNKHFLASKEDAKAHLALMQLHRLRDCYRQGWVPDLKLEKPDKFCIIKNSDFFTIYQYSFRSCFLSFQTLELAQQFLDNFRDLIKEAGDLI